MDPPSPKHSSSYELPTATRKRKPLSCVGSRCGRGSGGRRASAGCPRPTGSYCLLRLVYTPATRHGGKNRGAAPRQRNRYKRFSGAFWRVRRSYSRWYDGGAEARSYLGSFISKKRRAASEYEKSKELRPCARRKKRVLLPIF